MLYYIIIIVFLLSLKKITNSLKEIKIRTEEIKNHTEEIKIRTEEIKNHTEEIKNHTEEIKNIQNKKLYRKKLLDKDTSSIISEFICDPVYDINEKILPKYRIIMPLTSIRHPYVKIVKTTTLKKKLSLYSCIGDYEIIENILNNKYLEKQIREISNEITFIKENYYKYYLIYCPYIDILEKHIENIKWNELSSTKNPDIIKFIEKYIDINIDLLNWVDLSENPLATNILKNNINRINWYAISYNKNAGEILYQNQNKIINYSWDIISKFQSNLKLLETNINKLNWDALSSNPNAIEILKKHKHLINWNNLCSIPEAIELIKNEYNSNSNKINWIELSKNKNAIELLELNQNKIDWDNLCLNENAIKILTENQNKINWEIFIHNKSITRELFDNNIDKFWIDINLALLTNNSLYNLIIVENKKMSKKKQDIITNMINKKISFI